MTTTISGSTGVNQITDDAITDAKLPAGSVLQVVSAASSTAQTVATDIWTDTGLTASITPSSSSSKIKVDYVFLSIYFALAQAGASFRVVRDSTALYTPSAGYAIWSTTASWYGNYSDMELDSPSTTSAITYKIQVRCYQSAKAILISDSSYYRNSITLMEIAG
jgi:hypothetical protein